MSEEVQLAWRLSIAGADQVKRELATIHDQFNKGELTVAEYGKELNKQNSTLRALTNNSALQNRMWLSQHPIISQLSRSMSGFNRVLSASTQALTLMNTASLLMRTDSGQLIELTNQLAQAERAYNAELDPTKKEEYARQMAAAKTAIEELNKNTSQDHIQAMLSFGVGLGTIATTSISAGIGLKGAGIGFGIFGSGAKVAAGGLRAVWLALGPVGLAMIALSIIIPLIIDNWDSITAAFSGFADYLSHTFAPVLKWLEENWKILLIALTGGLGALVIFFMDNWGAIQKGLEDAWTAITTGLSTFWEGFKNITTGAVDTVIKSVTGMVDGIIKAVKNALDWLAKLPGNIAKGVGDLFSGGSKSSSSGSNVKKGAAGLHEITNGPTMFMAGEGGVREEVSIKPLGRAGGSTSSESNVKKGAAGLHDITNGPQLYLAGEGGVREEVSIKSIGRAGGSSSGALIINNYIHNDGSLLAQKDLEGMLNEYGVRQARRRGWHAR